jgi:hypothetical protein
VAAPVSAGFYQSGSGSEFRFFLLDTSFFEINYFFDTNCGVIHSAY